MRSGNLFESLRERGGTPDELVEVLLTATNVRIERIVSEGHRSPDGFWYDQDEHEWVTLLRGRAGLECDGTGEQVLGPGDWVFLPAHTRHRVTWTAPDEPTLWLAVFVSLPEPSSA